MLETVSPPKNVCMFVYACVIACVCGGGGGQGHCRLSKVFPFTAIENVNSYNSALVQAKLLSLY